MNTNELEQQRHEMLPQPNHDELARQLKESGDEAWAYGFFAVQKIDWVGTELYAGVRLHELDHGGTVTQVGGTNFTTIATSDPDKSIQSLPQPRKFVLVISPMPSISGTASRALSNSPLPLSNKPWATAGLASKIAEVATTMIKRMFPL